MSTTTLVDKRWKVYTFISGGLFIVALVFAIVFGVLWAKQKTKVAQSQTQIEQLQKDNGSLQNQVTILTDNKRELQNNLDVAGESIKSKEVVIKQLNDENHTLGTIKVQISEMEKATAEINASNDKLKKIQQQMRTTIDQRQKANSAVQSSLK